MEHRKLFFVLLISLLAYFTPVKADTIYIQLPVSPMPEYCQPSGFDTFVFIKPNGWGYTGWSVNSGPIVYCDSLTVIPTSVGVYGIGLVSGVNSFGTGLKLYSTAPPHANFTVTSGGSMANDTAWMCGNSIVIDPNVITSDASYRGWTGPYAFSSGLAIVTLTQPGTYIFERGNPCDTIRDTLEVVALPTVLPILGADTSFCNVPVSIMLDAGPGWNYTWNTGDHTQTLAVTIAGTYTVNLSNLCTSGSASIVVEHQSYPAPDLTYQEGLLMCSDSVLVLDPSPGHSYDTYQWQWSGGIATTPTLSISGPMGNGTYTVTVTQGGCTAEATGSFYFLNAPVIPEICVVTVNPALNKNMIVYTADLEPDPIDPNYSPVIYYNMYKWAGGSNWTLLGNVPFGQDHIFTDMTSSPPTVSARYKITMVDACGVESAKSFYHQTILLSVMSGANPGEIPLIWTEYRDEGDAFVVDQYQIWRGNHPDSLEFYAETPFTSYNDTGVYVQKYYQIVVTRLGGCDPAPAGSKSGERSLIAGSSSNITNNIVTGIADTPSSINISVYPNPSAGVFHLEGIKISRVEVTDGAGKLLLVTDQPTIDLSDYTPGFYIATVYTNQGSTTRKLLRY